MHISENAYKVKMHVKVKMHIKVKVHIKVKMHTKLKMHIKVTPLALRWVHPESLGGETFERSGHSIS